MANGFMFRYNIGADAVTPINDYATGATVPAQSAVKFNAGGQLVIAAPGDAIFGISEGPDYATGYAKVRTSTTAAYEVPYVGTTKTTLTDTDLDKLFDIDATALNINLDAAGASQFRLLKYDNTRKIAVVKIAKSAL
jgi:hypothetical protein